MNESRPWYRHPGRLAGIAIAAYFGLKFLVLVHLGLVGQIVPGFSGRLSPGEAVEPGAPVLYFYRVGEASHHGWRRGIEYGGEPLSVVHSPLIARLHVASPRTGLQTPLALWSEPDYWFRLLVAVGGFGLGWFIERLWGRFERRGGLFLHGLTRDRSH